MSALAYSVPPMASDSGSSASSVSSETEVGEQIFDYPPTAPFKFGPGVYQVIGLSTGDALEHSTSRDDPVIKSACHDGDNQKWEFISLGTGYMIRCVQCGLYLDYGHDIHNGTKIMVSDCPDIWSVKYDEKCGLATISCSKRNYNLDMKPDRRSMILYEGASNRGNIVTNQWFKLNWLGHSSTTTGASENAVQESRRDTRTGSTWLTTTTTTVTTKTTVTRIIRRVD